LATLPEWARAQFAKSRQNYALSVVHKTRQFHKQFQTVKMLFSHFKDEVYGNIKVMFAILR